MNLELPSKEAKLIVDYSVNVQKGETVVIWGSTESIPLVKELYREIIRAGGHPITKLDVPGLPYIMYSEGKSFQLSHPNPLLLYLVKNVDVAIRIRAPSNPEEISNIDTRKTSKYSRSFAEFYQIFFQRQATGELKWIVAPYPTEGAAQHAKMSYEEYWNLVEKSLFLDKIDPIAEWKELSRKQQIYCDFLDNADKIRIKNKDTDLEFSVKGRKWLNFDGKKDLPDGEIFTGPIEDSANGYITFSFPGVYQGQILENIYLKFKNGQVIEAKTSTNQNLLDDILKIPGSDRIGEFGIGTNPTIDKFIKNILFDEKIAGTIHIALGLGYPDTGSKNKGEIHWDILTDMRDEGEIYSDGKLIYQKGVFLI